MKKVQLPFISLTIFILVITSFSSNVLAIDGVYHDPYGDDALYSIQATERAPRDPVAGENVYIKITTWPVEPGQSAWVTWTKNGVSQPSVDAEYKYNEGNNTYWEANLGSFEQGDVIQYNVHANKDGSNEKVIGPFTFTVTDWESVTEVTSLSDLGNSIVLSTESSHPNFTPKINILFENSKTARIQMSPTGNGTFNTGENNYSVTESSTNIEITTSDLIINIQKNPYKMSFIKTSDSSLITEEYDPSSSNTMSFLTDGTSIIDKVENSFFTPSSEEFYGFGERYNQFGKRGLEVDSYVYNQYRDQGDRTYLAIPYFSSSNNYGLLLNTTYYAKFKLASEINDKYTFTYNTGGKSNSLLDYTVFSGDNLEEVAQNFSEVSGKPRLLPKWAFGLWGSANEWDRQSEVTAAIDNAKQYDIPMTSMVLEQWSDEHTFYIFNDAQYTAKSGDQAFTASDFTFGGKWPDPKAMVDYAHQNDTKVLMWQIPVMKYTDYSYEQRDNDEDYMLQQGYAVKDGNGNGYRIPTNKWFGNSLLLDFTNPNATDWWMSKRAYLFDDIGIDGIKTDGGEMVWGRDTTFYNGNKKDEMRNQYPNEYIRAYHDFSKSKKSDAFTFSRAGTTGVQKYGAFWAGDQSSTFSAFQDALRAGLSSSMSGVPYWGWDLAGFTGEFPSAELYKRSFSFSTFVPIMQFHSEKANPSISEERSPWNVADRTGDSTVLDTSSFYANLRMNLLPYIYSEAKYTSDTGIPMMRSMGLSYPNDNNVKGLWDQYLFGSQLLIAPIVNEGVNERSIYLPEGEWIDFFYHAKRPGNQTISYYADVDSIPVFVQAGSIIPLNLNSNYEIGGTIGNDVNEINNLVFRIYPQGTSSYNWFDDSSNTYKTISSNEDLVNQKITIEVPVTNEETTLQVFASKPTSVSSNGTTLTQHSSLSELTLASNGWYYDSEMQLTYMKLDQNSQTQTVVLDGVNEASYEAEYAEQTNVTTNTNHIGYTGTGFVDGFETSGDSISFDVQVPSSSNYKLDIRYSSAGGDASRAIYINGVKITDVNLPSTVDWDTWNVASTSQNLNEGKNTITIQYDSNNELGINVDSLSIRP